MKRTYRFSLGPSKTKQDVKLVLLLASLTVALIVWVFRKPFLESREADRVMKAVGLFSVGKPLPASDEYEVVRDESSHCHAGGVERLYFHSLSPGPCLGLSIAVPKTLVSMGVAGQEKCLTNKRTNDVEFQELCAASEKLSVFVSRVP